MFRKATNDDIPIIKTIIYSVLHEYGLKPDESTTDADLNDIEKNYQNGYFGVVQYQNKIVGTLALYHISDKECEIRKMYLLPKVRGQGIGIKMLQFLLAKAKEKNYIIASLETATVLKKAIELYIGFGFKEMHRPNQSPRCDKHFSLFLNTD